VPVELTSLASGLEPSACNKGSRCASDKSDHRVEGFVAGQRDHSHAGHSWTGCSCKTYCRPGVRHLEGKPCMLRRKLQLLQFTLCIIFLPNAHVRHATPTVVALVKLNKLVMSSLVVQDVDGGKVVPARKGFDRGCVEHIKVGLGVWACMYGGVLGAWLEIQGPRLCLSHGGRTLLCAHGKEEGQKRVCDVVEPTLLSHECPSRLTWQRRCRGRSTCERFVAGADGNITCSKLWRK
jgi:hypothetical protein